MLNSRRRDRMILCGAVLLTTLLGACGGDSADRMRLSSRYPPDRARGAVRVAKAGDLQAAHQLVNLLEDDDRAVRLYAIRSLEQLTGPTYGYRYYADDASRTAAVSRWRDALRAGRFDDSADSTSAAPEGPHAAVGARTEDGAP